MGRRQAQVRLRLHGEVVARKDGLGRRGRRQKDIRRKLLL